MIYICSPINMMPNEERYRQNVGVKIRTETVSSMKTSLAAIGLWGMLISCAQEGVITLKDLAKFSKEGRHKITSMLKELIDERLMVSAKPLGEAKMGNPMSSKTNYIVFDRHLSCQEVLLYEHLLERGFIREALELGNSLEATETESSEITETDSSDIENI